MQTSPRQEIERYLGTGEHDCLSRSWPGDHFLARAQHGDAALRDALVSTVRQRTVHAVAPAALAGIDDFVVHEAAPIFHNCKRRTIGLSATPRREWLLDIDYRNCETFAYACETYRRILEPGNSLAARRMLLSEIEEGPVPPDDSMDPDEYIDILREAVADRNGWKRIQRRCSPAQAQRRREVGAK